jgi:hypothetical protein
LENSELSLLLVRAVERLVSVGIGGMCVYLGYRLFINLPSLPAGDGNLSFIGKTSMTLSRVGPGVFFSLFGAVVVTAALNRPLTWEKIEKPDSVTRRVSGSAPGMPRVPEPARSIPNVVAETAIGYLNAVPGLLHASVEDAQRKNIGEAIRQAKLALIRSIWNDEWGKWEAFETWTVLRGTPPVAAGVPVQLFENSTKP